MLAQEGAPGAPVSDEHVEILKVIAELRRTGVWASVRRIGQKLGREVTVKVMLPLVRDVLVNEVEAPAMAETGYELTIGGYAVITQAGAIDTEPVEAGSAGALDQVWIPVSKAATVVGKDRDSVYRAIKRGELDARQIGGQLMVKLAQLRPKVGERPTWSFGSIDPVRFILAPGGPARSPEDRLVYLALYANMDGESCALVSPDLVSKSTGLPVSVVETTLRELEQAGLVKRVPDQGTARAYRLSPPWNPSTTGTRKGAS